MGQWRGVPVDIADLIGDAILRRPESFRHYVSSAGFKMHAEVIAPVLVEVQAEMRALPLPEPKVTECLSAIVERLLVQMERHATEGEMQARLMLEEMATRPVPRIIQYPPMKP